jgi:hypothetical protein
MADTPMKTIVCCADHDHATDPACEIKASSVTVPLTADEIAAQQVAAQAAEDQQAAAAAEAAAVAAAKESAQAKLTALGLTADEIAALSK